MCVNFSLQSIVKSHNSVSRKLKGDSYRFLCAEHKYDIQICSPRQNFSKNRLKKRRGTGK